MVGAIIPYIWGVKDALCTSGDLEYHSHSQHLLQIFARVPLYSSKARAQLSFQP